MVYVAKPSVGQVVLVLEIVVNVDYLYVEYNVHCLPDFKACQV